MDAPASDHARPYFFNEDDNRLATDHGQPSIVTASRKARETPLLFHPGNEWEYGSNIDGVGQVIEAIAGKRLGEVMAVRPLGGQRRLGRAREPLLLNRPPHRHRRLLGNADPAVPRRPLRHGLPGPRDRGLPGTLGLVSWAYGPRRRQSPGAVVVSCKGRHPGALV